MSRKIVRAVTLGLAGFVVTGCAALGICGGGGGDGWRSLFDGKSLDGWTQRNGTATYCVEDGAIVGQTAEGSPNAFLCTDKNYANFELKFEVKVDDELNSGVQIRSNTEGGPQGRVNGPQVEIEATGENGALSGYVYGEHVGGWMTSEKARKPHQYFKNGAWNAYRVLAVGATIKVWINGALISDLTDPEKFKSHPRGFIGLQVHSVGAGSGPFEVRWRNLQIREIEDQEGWVSLYNGKDLHGWTTTGNWIAQENGVLLIQPRPGEEGWQRFSAYLWSVKKYGDFVLDLEYAYPPGGNSGVYFRVGDIADPVKTGIEAQVLDSSGNKGEMTAHDHGGIISTVAASKNMSKLPGQWNHMVVTCRGHHLQVELNGEKIVDVGLDTSPIKDRPLEGHIGLQDHGEPNEIQFRNLRLKEL
jgi:hypothetical protein